MNILICDDEELIRNVIKEYLLLDNFIVDEATDGEMALNKVKSNNYDSYNGHNDATHGRIYSM